VERTAYPVRRLDASAGRTLRVAVGRGARSTYSRRPGIGQSLVHYSDQLLVQPALLLESLLRANGPCPCHEPLASARGSRHRPSLHRISGSSSGLDAALILASVSDRIDRVRECHVEQFSVHPDELGGQKEQHLEFNSAPREPCRRRNRRNPPAYFILDHILSLLRHGSPAVVFDGSTRHPRTRHACRRRGLRGTGVLDCCRFLCDRSRDHCYVRGRRNVLDRRQLWLRR